jgi:hypothetical protein
VSTFALFILHTLLNVIIRCSQLITQCLLGRHSEGGLLVIDAVVLRSMYFVVMPKVNLIVILVTYVRYLYSINCLTVICLPNMLFLSYRETPLVNCGPRSNFLYIAIPFTFTRTVYFYSYTITFYHLIRSIIYLQQTGEIDNLIVSWGKVLGCVVCRFHVAAGAKQSFGQGALQIIRSCHKASRHHLLKFGFLLLVLN